MLWAFVAQRYLLQQFFAVNAVLTIDGYALIDTCSQQNFPYKKYT